MKVLVKTAGMEREEWLRWRRRGIGGSDASILAGVNKFRSIFQLWQDKTGKTEPEETESEYAHFGTLLEPVVKQEFTRRTGKKVRSRKAILQSEEHPFMLADLDGVVYENGKLCIFEAKTASAYKLEAWEAGIPLEYQYQIQHYMAVTGAEKTYIATLVGGNHFIYHEAFREEEMISKLISMEQAFWEECVLGGKEPVADGSEATTRFLNGKYPQSNGAVLELPKEALSLCSLYDDLSSQICRLEQRREAVTNQMKGYLKEYESGTVGDRKISWKTVHATAFDKKRLQKEHREIYDAYCVPSCYRRLTVA